MCDSSGDIWDRQAVRYVSLLLCLALVGTTSALFAQESINEVMERMKSTSAVSIAYRETRYLELFEKPVEASGTLYGMPPDLLIKEQRSPSREVLGVFADRYYYFNPTGEVRRTRAKDPEDPLNLHITAFQSLANGNLSLMYDVYDVAFVSEPDRWYLILTQKNVPRSPVRITVSGPERQRADRMEIHEDNGDRSVYQLEKDGEGESVRGSIDRLVSEITGR